MVSLTVGDVSGSLRDMILVIYRSVRLLGDSSVRLRVCATPGYELLREAKRITTGF
jgi:hypothetical protein